MKEPKIKVLKFINIFIWCSFAIRIGEEYGKVSFFITMGILLTLDMILSFKLSSEQK